MDSDEEPPIEPSKPKGFIEQMLAEEDERRKAEKAAKKGLDPKLEKTEIGPEAGPVQEGLVEKAQAKRARERIEKTNEAKQKRGNAELVWKKDDTELGKEEEVEEEQEVEALDGMVLEPFNMKQERAEGTFDEEGHYLEREARADDDDKEDAWLKSAGEEVVSAKVLRMIEERERRLEEAEAAPAISLNEIGALKAEIATILQPGENVTRALKRLGAGAARPKPAKKAKTGAAAAAQPPAPAQDPAQRAQFEKLTEAASALMDSGELDVYSLRKEDFDRAAAAFAPKPGDDDDSDDDMFGTAAPRPAAARPAGGGIGPATQAQPEAGPSSTPEAASEGGPSVGPSATSAAASSSQAAAADYSSWPIKELRRFLQERGVDSQGCVEKGELVALVQQEASKGPEGATEGVPEGYTFDPQSGYYYSKDADLYYDAQSGGFYSSGTEKWYSYNVETQALEEWAGAQGTA